MKINKIRIFTIILVLLLGMFFYLDTKAYYYGFGFGFFSSKLPSRFSILFAGSDLGNQGIILEENSMRLWIIFPNCSIFLSDTEKKIIVKRFTGYWFNQKTIVVKIIDEHHKTRYIEIYEEVTNALYPNFFCKEMIYPPGEYDNLTYIDIDKTLMYFKNLKLLKNLIGMFFVFALLYTLKLVYSIWSKYIIYGRA